MQGFASELLGEVFTKGKGPFGQIGIPLGQPLNSEYAGVALAVWVSCHCYLCALPSGLPPCMNPFILQVPANSTQRLAMVSHFCDERKRPCLQVGFFLFAAIGFGNFGQQEGNDEIY